MLNGPSSAPAGAVTVPAGNNADFADSSLKPNTTYWFAPGVHTLGTGEFSQIQPQQGDTFIGAPGAVLSGQNRNDSAFDSNASGVTIEFLTIQDFTPPGSQGAVNHESAQGWLVTHNTLQNNSPGAAMMIGSDNTVTFNCLTKNGEYGFNAFSAGAGLSALTGGPNNITLSNNEISFNNTCNFEAVSPNPVPSSMRPSNCSGAGQGDGCGCSGAGKFWEVDNATVNSNYVHDNFDVGLWADTNNNGFTFKGNFIKNNWGPGLMYETSYNAVIADNTFIANAIGVGPTNGGFPEGAIYLSESGGDPRVPNTAGIGTLTISGNTFTNNWSGVVAWESSDRFCGSPNNTSTGICTLTDPSVANIRTCNQSHLQGASPGASPDMFNLCRWKTQNVQVTGNTFNTDPSAIPGCNGSSNSCGENALFSQFGTSPSWTPYKGMTIPDAIVATQEQQVLRQHLQRPLVVHVPRPVDRAQPGRLDRTRARTKPGPDPHGPGRHWLATGPVPFAVSHSRPRQGVARGGQQRAVRAEGHPGQPAVAAVQDPDQAPASHVPQPGRASPGPVITPGYPA